jgi:hypothetical protein
MEKNSKKNRLIYPYLILTIALVCAVLILAELWANVGDLVPHPWEGPSPTPTLWWRSPKTATPTPSAADVLPAIADPLVPQTSVTIKGPTLEDRDG